MGVLSIILLVLFVISALLLIFLVAVQDEKSQGLGGIFGGSSDSTFGTGSSKFLTKATTIIAIAFVVLALLVGLTTKTDASSSLLDTAASVQSDAWYNASSAPAADAAAETATVSE